MPDEVMVCEDTLALGWSFTDVTDFNTAYPGSLTVVCTDCNGNSQTATAGEDYTPDDGCEWDC